jgi:hypothetical protein
MPAPTGIRHLAIRATQREKAMTKEKIIQIMPADGWYALFFDDNAPHSKLKRLIAFVLLEGKDGHTWFDGLEGDMGLCLGRMHLDANGRWESPHFKNFFHETEITDELKEHWAQEAKTFLTREPARESKSYAIDR